MFTLLQRRPLSILIVCGLVWLASCAAPLASRPTESPASVPTVQDLFASPSPSNLPEATETAAEPEIHPDAQVILKVETEGPVRPISEHIYGMSFADTTQITELGLSVNRWGGNGTTRYNWQYDISNRASDWFFQNIPNPNDAPEKLPDGSSSDKFVELNQSAGVQTILTIPMIGWTPRSREFACGFSVELYGQQQYTDSWHPECGNGVGQDGKYITGNDPADTSSPIDEHFVQEWIQHLNDKYGTADEGGVLLYNLDNEPMLWNVVHRDVHPEAVGYDEVRDLTYRYAAALKAVDPGAKTLGPSEWGWSAYFYSARDLEAEISLLKPDQLAHGGTPFLAWYLQQMKNYEQEHGLRILDYLDVHYYPQAGGIAFGEAGDANFQQLRLRSTRSLWDPEYVDESWIDEPVMLIPRLQAWVNEYYPGTKLALTEYNFGGLEDLNGALTQAEVLGVFGREGLDLATLWSPPSIDQPGAFAFRMYRNYDGKGGHFGNLSLPSSSSDPEQLSVFAARQESNSDLTLMVINKTSNPIRTQIQISGLATDVSGQIYQYSGADLGAVQRLPDLVPDSDNWMYDFPAESITLLVFKQ
jgi:hypothetical protein